MTVVTGHVQGDVENDVHKTFLLSTLTSGGWCERTDRRCAAVLMSMTRWTIGFWTDANAVNAEFAERLTERCTFLALVNNLSTRV